MKIRQLIGTGVLTISNTDQARSCTYFTPLKTPLFIDPTPFR